MNLSQLYPFSVATGPFVEELFEVTSCYFPIDFTPVSSTFILDQILKSMSYVETLF